MLIADHKALDARVEAGKVPFICLLYVSCWLFTLDRYFADSGERNEPVLHQFECCWFVVSPFLVFISIYIFLYVRYDFDHGLWGVDNNRNSGFVLLPFFCCILSHHFPLFPRLP